MLREQGVSTVSRSAVEQQWPLDLKVRGDRRERRVERSGKTKDKEDKSDRKEKQGRWNARSEQLSLNREICACADRGDFEALLNTVARKQTRMNLVNLSTALHRLARMSAEEGICKWDRDDHRVRALREQIRVQLERLLVGSTNEPHARCLSTIAWACGRLQDYDANVMQMVGELAESWMAMFKTFELANLLWGFAKLQLASASLFQAAQDHICSHMSEFSTRSLSLVAWAFATARPHSSAKFLRRAADAFAGILSPQEEKPVSLANLVWGLATSGAHSSQDTLRIIGNACVAVLSSFKANEISITLWAFVRLTCFHEALFFAAADRLSKEHGLRSEIHSQGIANILWAFSRFAENCNTEAVAAFANVLSALLPTCQRLLPRLSPIEFSSTLCAASKLAARSGTHVAADRLLAAAAEVASQKESRFLSQLSWQSVSGLMSAFGDHLHRQPEAQNHCGGVMKQLEQLREGFGPGAFDASQEVSSLYLEPMSTCVSPEGDAPLPPGLPQQQAAAPEARAGFPASAFSATAPPVPAPAAEARPLHPMMKPGAAHVAAATAATAGAAAATATAAVTAPALEPMRVQLPNDVSRPGLSEQVLSVPAYVTPTGLGPPPMPRDGLFKSPWSRGGLSGFDNLLRSAPGPAVNPITVPLPDAETTEEVVTETVSIAVVPEFCHIWQGPVKEVDAPVIVAFEVPSLANHESINIVFEVLVNGCSVDSVDFEVDLPGLYCASLPTRSGPWSLQLTPRSPVGDVVGEAKHLPFYGAWCALVDIALASPELMYGGSQADSCDGVSTSASVEDSVKGSLGSSPTVL